MWMWVLSYVVPVVLPGGLGLQVSWVTETPVLHLNITHGSTLVEVADGHGSLVSLVINGLGSKVPLSSFPKSLEDVIWAHFHNRDFLIVALSSAGVGCTVLVLSDFSVATSWDLLMLESQEFTLLHVKVALSTLFVTKSLVLSVWVPVVVSLIISVVLVERVVQVTPEP